MNHPFDPIRGLIVVPTRLRGPIGDTVARLALDTGATRTLVSWQVALSVGYEPATSAKRIEITTGSGVEFAPEIIVDSIEALSQIRESISIVCHTLPPSATVDGVLGLDFLRGKRLEVDFRAGRLRVE